MKDYFGYTGQVCVVTGAASGMGKATAENGVTYTSHTWTSPLENKDLLESSCAQCHTDLTGQVRAIQEETERRTYAIGYLLEGLTEKLVLAAESGEYTEEEFKVAFEKFKNDGKPKIYIYFKN